MRVRTRTGQLTLPNTRTAIGKGETVDVAEAVAKLWIKQGVAESLAGEGSAGSGDGSGDDSSGDDDSEIRGRRLGLTRPPRHRALTSADFSTR